MNDEGMTKELEHFKMNPPREQTIARTWQIPYSLVRRLNARAGALSVYPSQLVTWLLNQGLDQLEAGAWTVPTQPDHRNIVIEDR